MSSYAKAATTHAPAGFLGRLDNLSDWLNPIVVKEVRQMVRGREFNYSFGLSLVIGLTVALFGGAGAMSGDSTSGSWIFAALTTCLTLVGLAVVPIGTFSALRNERAEQTLDLVILTTLTPRRLVVGKLLAQGIKLVTLFAGLSPFMAMSFLLGGIDLITILISLAELFMWSLWACAFCLFLSSVSKSRAMSGVIFACIGILLFVFLLMDRPFYFLGVGSGSRGFWPNSWWLLAVTTSFCLMTMVNLVLLAENRLSPPTEDRVTALRASFFVLFLLILAWAVVPLVARVGYSGSDGIDLLGVAGGAHLAVVAIFSVTEDLALPRRLLRQKTTRTRWGRATAIFRPGGGRGAQYMLAQMGLFLITGWWLASSFTEWRWLLAICGYICFFTGMPACAGRLLAPARATADYLRVAGLLFFPVVSLFADVLYYLFTPSHIFDGVYSVYHVLNPFRTLANWPVVERNHWDLLALGVGLIGLLSYLVLMQMSRRVNDNAG